MAVAKLTKFIIDGMTKGVLWDTLCVGFGARKQTRDVHYLLRYRINGRQRFQSIGRHGSPWTVETARAEARRLMGLVVSGEDIGAKPFSDLFGDLIERYLSSLRLRPRSIPEYQRYLKVSFAKLHRLPIGDIVRRDISSILGDIERNSGASTRNRARAILSAFYTWAIREGYVEANPVLGTAKATEKARDRVLSPDELVRLWRALGTDPFSEIVRLLMLTGQRCREIGDLQWSEIQGEAILLPAERCKNHRAHTIHLTKQALTIIDRQPRRGPYLFGIEAGFRAWDRHKTLLDAKLGLPKWTLHDVRRSAATGMAELGIAPHIIETILNHSSGHKGGIAGIYNRAKYGPECRAALVKWSDYLDQLQAPDLRLVG
jgi:integrase